MHRAGKILAWVIGTLSRSPILLACVVLIVANTDPGRRLIEAATEWATAGTVKLDGIDGRFPDALPCARCASSTIPAYG